MTEPNKKIEIPLKCNSKKVRIFQEFIILFTNNFVFTDIPYSVEADVIQNFISSRIAGCSIKQAEKMLNEVLIRHDNGIDYIGISVKSTEWLYYIKCGEAYKFKNFIERDFVKDTTATPISKTKMLSYFNHFVSNKCLKKQPKSKIEKELDKLVESEIIEEEKCYIGYKYIAFEEQDAEAQIGDDL
jgi:hypothetical protein